MSVLARILLYHRDRSGARDFYEKFLPSSARFGSSIDLMWYAERQADSYGLPLYAILTQARKKGMRPQEHAKLSAVAAVAAWPWLKQDVWIPYVASILIDTDHFAWYALSQRSLNLRAAARFFRQGKAPHRPEVRLLHQPAVLALLLLLAVRTRSRLLGLILGGLVFHVCLDRYHQAQMRHLQQVLHEQAHFTCPHCGQSFPEMELHTLRRQKNLLEQYKPDRFILLCHSCHAELHRKKGMHARPTSRSML
jgi:hypothetical protein